MLKRMLNYVLLMALVLVLAACGSVEKTEETPAADEIGRASCRERV